MRSLRQLLSILVTAVVVLQPAVACCGEPQTVTNTAAEPVAVQRAPHAAAAGHDHCGDPPPAAPDDSQHRCECGDGCASMEARSASTPDAIVLQAGSEVQPAAVVTQPPPVPPAPRAVSARGVPPPTATPLARPTLVTLKRLLLI